MRCAQCRHYLTGGRSRGRSRHYPYYRCSQKACASGTSYRTALIDGEFATFLRSITPAREDILQLRDSITRAVRKRVAERRIIHERRRSEAERLKKRQEQLIQMRMQQVISSQEFMTYNSNISRQRIALSEEGDPPLEEGRILSKIDEICAPLAHLEQTWLSLPPLLKQRFQRMVLPVGFAMGEIGTAEMSCLFSTFQRTRSRESIEVPPGGQFLNRLCQEVQAFSEVLRMATADPALTAIPA
jgi:hypothetical protein